MKFVADAVHVCSSLFDENYWKWHTVVLSNLKGREKAFDRISREVILGVFWAHTFKKNTSNGDAKYRPHCSINVKNKVSVKPEFTITQFVARYCFLEAVE